MAKAIDITERLDFDGNPAIKVKDMEIEVSADAATMLKVMGILRKNEHPGVKEVLEMYELLFTEAERAKIEVLKLNFRDFTELLNTAMTLITGEEDDRGEQ